MAKVNPLDHCRPIFVDFKILTVVNLYIYHVMLSSFKNINCHNLRSDLHNFNTRNKGQLDVPFVRLQKTKSSHIIMGLKCLNKLPKEVLQLPLKSFKGKILAWLHDNPFYNINEFFNICTKDMVFN